MLVLAMKFSRYAPTNRARRGRPAPTAPHKAAPAHLHNGTEDERPGLEEGFSSRGLNANECFNWVSILGTKQMSVNRAELDSLERR